MENMKLHQTLVERIVKLTEINSGWPDEKKLKAALARLNITTYTQQDTGKIVLVDADQMAKIIRGVE